MKRSFVNGIIKTSIDKRITKSMERAIVLSIWILLLFCGRNLFANDSLSQYKIVFYNVENLFDPTDDSLKNDDSFTPTGFNHWTYKKMMRKIANIAKVLLHIGEGEPPEVVCLAEVENLNVLQKLCRASPLRKYGYQIIHYDSPDRRGIEVAMLYRPDRVKVVYSEALPVIFPFEPAAQNRDILYAVIVCAADSLPPDRDIGQKTPPEKTDKPLPPQRDTLHLFVNHWTSRYGGYAATVPKRNYYAATVKRKADSVLRHHPDARLYITGDFNDYPTDESVSEILQARAPDEGGGQLFNLMLPFARRPNVGSHKHEDFWGCLDQIIVSKALLDTNNTLHILHCEAHILTADFLLEPDEKYGGVKVHRTFSGPRYIGGYSDHLPVYVQLIQRRKKKE